MTTNVFIKTTPAAKTPITNDKTMNLLFNLTLRLNIPLAIFIVVNIDARKGLTFLTKENSDEIQLLKSIKQKVEFIKVNPFYGDNIPKDLIPKNHIEFMLSTALFHETDSYIFVHAGCDPGIPLSEQDGDFLVWDRSLFLRAKNILIKNLDWTWEKPIITGHNHVGPFITEKFMMLDCSGAKKLIITELNSMEAYEARLNKKRLVKTVLQETKVKKPVFRRVDA